MILHPGILSLIVGTAVVFLLMARASLLGITILRRWDFASSSDVQLDLERKTYLVSTIVSVALGFVIASSLLFVYTVDSIHPLFVGAMCATGSLNANPVGWYALMLKVILFFAAAFWISLNRLDQRAGDFPLIKGKYRLLLVIMPLVGLDLFLQLRYFLGLEPEVITSCCGSLFSGEGGVAAEMAGLPLHQTRAVFFGALAAFGLLAALCFKLRTPLFRYLLLLVSAGSFFVSIAAVVSFLSLYIYEIPTHHCPFDIVQQEYRFVGYPLYAGLFGGTYFGMLPGLFQPLKRIRSLSEHIVSAERRWLVTGLILMGLFAAIALWNMLSGTFTLTV